VFAPRSRGSKARRMAVWRARPRTVGAISALGLSPCRMRCMWRCCAGFKPDRQACDVFPSHYRLNSFAGAQDAFSQRRIGPRCFLHMTSEPAYFGSSWLRDWRRHKRLAMGVAAANGGNL